MRRSRFMMFGAAALFLSCTLLPGEKGWAWQATRSTPTIPQIQTSTPPRSNFPDMDKRPDEDSARVRMEESAAKARNTDRFKRIQTETERLLKLSTELKMDVDKSTKNELSLDVIRKAEEIEKLAHDVKERMKG